MTKYGGSGGGSGSATMKSDPTICVHGWCMGGDAWVHEVGAGSGSRIHPRHSLAALIVYRSPHTCIVQDIDVLLYKVFGLYLCCVAVSLAS